MTTWAEDAKAALDAVEDLTANSARVVLGDYEPVDAIAAVAATAAAGGGGAVPVSCLLARDNSLQVNGGFQYPISWDEIGRAHV